MAYTKTLIMRPVPPFDFDLSLMIFSNGDPDIRRYQNGKFWQVIRVDKKLILATVRAFGKVDQPKLYVELGSDHEISEEDKEKARQVVTVLLNLDLDLKPFYEHAKKDETLADVVQRLKGLKSPTTLTAFEALIDSIIEQQISLNVAHVLEVKLIKTFGGTLRLDGEVYYAYPTPRELASASVEQLRRCGLSTRKAEYVKEVSKMVADGRVDLEALKRCDAQTVISELDKIRGIGVWTAELTAVRGMRKQDVIPADDLRLRRAISRYYFGDQKISASEARKVAETWGKWKASAAFYLIIAYAMKNGRDES